ncbi:hypothetical protein DICPUDRAFT_75571 [Dictyostelium purpureum]|uniref:Phosphatidic acid phosphatase type 2/haloperoxidase domain-containing protein n=1 Tax=Dictyostelium purpureum TaxID=5786 RepID=F0ZB17_DICPU|nr:uncharacterized protein DICPUDRAFT_75571 [Dictyostelium purpureum]EGC38815.1 hypothetical protein DICPUDRAFT_75571 [Dictyostelium purpureum]|eukprot:XP_003284609.1 hypothetical protein DICPUDRAFT_75571 [Dictyostelium purpureum]
MIHNVAHYKKNKWYTKQHLIDWFTCAGIFITESIIFNFVLQPNVRYEPDGSNFQAVQYPLLPDIVPAWLLMIIAIVLPMIVFLGFFINHRNGHDLHHAALGLFQAFTITMLFTDTLKIIAGRLRPDYGARVALNDAALIRDGRQSFPSGHSSVSFCGMTFLAFYLCGKTRVFLRDGGNIFTALICLSPFMVSSLVAVSRVVDYHHNFDDILAGSVLGLAISSFVYFMNFNSLFSKQCSLPKNRINPHYAKNALITNEDYVSLSFSQEA